MDSKLMGKEIGLASHRGRDVSALMFVLEAQRDDTAIDEITLAENADLFPIWDINWTGKRGTILQDEGQLYRSIHDVGVGQNTKPSQTPSMWTLVGNPGEEFPKWVQPLGAHDAYTIGDKVTHNGERWISTHNGNIWAPGVFGWNKA